MDDVSQKYKKMSQREHLLQRPGMYMGSIYNTLEEVWVLDNEKMVKKNIMYNPGLLKLFDEIIMNSTDHARENPDKVTTIKIEVDNDKISILNDGPGIPIIKHSEHGVYIPELIFSHFLTSTNYNDNEKRLKAGLNGLGAKITSAFSKLFQIETVSNGKIYIQNFCDNLETIEEPVIKNKNSKDYTKITFFPDFQRFKVNKISNATLKMLEKRAYDVAACTDKKITVYFNGKKLGIKDFREYVDLFLPEKAQKEKVVIEKDRWKIAICTSPFEEFQQISFVNGVSTMNGGTHVNYIINPVIKKIIEKYQKKVKETTIKQSFLRDNMMVFVFSLIENPEFKSQAKEELTTKHSLFGSECILDDNVIKKIEKMDMIQKMMEFIQFKENKALSSSDGKKKLRLIGIPKLDDASSAGGKQSSQCTLILTEGDSAKTFAISGLDPKDRTYYGIYPLRGKFLNVRDATAKQLLNNQEIKNLKAILGLQNGKKFNSLQELKKSMRYGKILILTDQDVDGSHIKGLLINFFHFFWPLLITDDTFITCLQTPIVKATKGKITKVFYNIPEYKQWKEKNQQNWKIKYYKGLGTSSSKEAKECFQDLDSKKVFYKAPNEHDQDAIRLAFQKNLSDRRKKWIRDNSGKTNFIDNKLRNIPIKKFIDEELVHFSIEDCERSIPNIMDGLKPSQRKVLYGTLKKNTTEEMKVDQLRGFISEKTAYHHGDTSLSETIISMNHDYVGSNNINLLEPCGQLGTRLMGGKDAASPRYISTKINPITLKIFKQEDSGLLTYLNDDGYPIEPEWYCPIIPMILVNGTSGIGTGYATNIPCYNPLEIINIIKGLLNDETYSINELKPWYRGFKGKIVRKENLGYSSCGSWKRTDRNTIEITELPIGVWTDNYTEFLDKLQENPDNNIHDIKNLKTDKTVHFVIKAPSLQIDNWVNDNLKIFKLTNSIPSNFTLFDENNKIKQFESAEEILYHFFIVREKLYKKRYNSLLEDYNDKIKLLSSKVLFIQKIIDGSIQVFRMPKNTIIEQLENLEFPKFENNYDYLLNIKVHQFTQEQIEKLEKEHNETLEQLDKHKSITYKDLWIEDLENLEKML